jgi:type VI secretion system protein ImpA
MAPERLIDPVALLEAIPGDDPAGEPVPFQVRDELEQARKEIDPNDFDRDDPARPAEPKWADWSGIIRLATRTLREQSKDLLVAARLTEALTKQQGFAGLADGLALLRGMIEQCWDRSLPVIEDGDLEVRAGPFNWLGDGDRGARFPPSVRAAPLLHHDGQALGWREWDQMRSGRGAISKEMFEKAVAAASREECQGAVDTLTRCIEELTGLSRALNERLGPVSPALTDLRTALGDCLTLAKQILERKGPAAASEVTVAEPSAANGEAEATVPAARGTLSRDDVYRRLAEAADLLERLEPHSPIPYLVRRAVELGAMPFPLLMRALIRDDSVLTNMNRELGIKESSAE